MSIAAIRSVFLYCTIINYGILLVWAVLSLVGFGPIRRMSTDLFGISTEAFNAVNYGGIVLYKSLVIIFNLVPLIALYLVA
jgi:hypothetical protein